jgi:hypothetical protein
MKMRESPLYRIGLAFGLAALTACGGSASGAQLKPSSSAARASVGDAPMATSFSGNWPLTVTHSLHFNGTHCLTLTDDGSYGWPHSGPARLGSNSGLFEVIGRLILVSIDDGGFYQNAGSVYAAAVRNGHIGAGGFEEIYGGETADSGKVVFGMKGAC